MASEARDWSPKIEEVPLLPARSARHDDARTLTTAPYASGRSGPRVDYGPVHRRALFSVQWLGDARHLVASGLRGVYFLTLVH